MTDPPRLSGTALVIGPLPPPYMGPAVSTDMLCRGLEAGGARVVHVNTQDQREVSKVGALDIRNLTLGLAHTAQLVRAARGNTVDFVYVPISQGRWGYLRDAALMAVARLLRRPYVVHLRGSNFQRFYAASSPPERFVIRKTLQWASMAIALTPSLRRVYDGLVPDERRRFLENGIDDPWPDGVAEVQRDRAERARRDPAALRVLFVANNFEIKGARTMVEAMARPGLEQATLRMVGSPSDAAAARTRELISSLGLEGRVELPGALIGDQKRAEYEWADVFAYPTENDGQPLVVIEAMAAGLPIVTSTYGGVPETVGDTGLIVEPRDPDALAEQLRRLIEEPGLRSELSSAARERFVSSYERGPYERRVAELFGELMDQR